MNIKDDEIMTVAFTVTVSGLILLISPFLVIFSSLVFNFFIDSGSVQSAYAVAGYMLLSPAVALSILTSGILYIYRGGNIHRPFIMLISLIAWFPFIPLVVYYTLLRSIIG